MNKRLNEATIKKPLCLSYTLIVHRLTYKNEYTCIVTTYNLIDHYHDPRNNKKNANHNTIKKTNIQGFIIITTLYKRFYKNKHRIQFNNTD